MNKKKNKYTQLWNIRISTLQYYMEYKANGLLEELMQFTIARWRINNQQHLSTLSSSLQHSAIRFSRFVQSTSLCSKLKHAPKVCNTLQQSPKWSSKLELSTTVSRILQHPPNNRLTKIPCDDNFIACALVYNFKQQTWTKNSQMQHLIII